MSLAAVIMVGVGDGSNENVWGAIAIAMAVAAIIGLVNGILIGGLKLNALITTLAVGLIVIGLVNRYGSTFAVQSRCRPDCPIGPPPASLVSVPSSGSASCSGPS